MQPMYADILYGYRCNSTDHACNNATPGHDDVTLKITLLFLEVQHIDRVIIKV